MSARTMPFPGSGAAGPPPNPAETPAGADLPGWMDANREANWTGAPSVPHVLRWVADALAGKVNGVEPADAPRLFPAEVGWIWDRAADLIAEGE